MVKLIQSWGGTQHLIVWWIRLLDCWLVGWFNKYSMANEMNDMLINSLLFCFRLVDWYCLHFWRGLDWRWMRNESTCDYLFQTIRFLWLVCPISMESQSNRDRLCLVIDVSEPRRRMGPQLNRNRSVHLDYKDAFNLHIDGWGADRNRKRILPILPSEMYKKWWERQLSNPFSSFPSRLIWNKSNIDR